MVHGLGNKLSGELGFCEACIHGKHKLSPFKLSTSKSIQPLQLIHSDMCGKMSSRSLGDAEYFVTFIDDYTHYTWTYPPKKKSDVFETFLRWKTVVENESEKKVKVLRTDGGGEYLSTEFKKFLDKSGIRHEQTAKRCGRKNESYPC